MARSTPDEGAIESHARGLLRRAGVRGQFPTPVRDIVAAAGLKQPDQSFLADPWLNEAPRHVQKAIRRLRGRVRAVLDRKAREVHVDPTMQNQGRVAFHTLHEVTHDILPWQRALAYADDDAILSPEIKVLFEREANIGASFLLFQGSHFRGLVRDYEIGMASILALAQTVGASGHATFRRFVKVHAAAMTGIVLDLSPCSQNPVGYQRREVVASQAWIRKFGHIQWPSVLWEQPFSFVGHGEAASHSVHPISTSFVLADLHNRPTDLNVEVYSNQYNLFVLIWTPRQQFMKRRGVILIPDDGVSV